MPDSAESLEYLSPKRAAARIGIGLHELLGLIRADRGPPVAKVSVGQVGILIRVDQLDSWWGWEQFRAGWQR